MFASKGVIARYASDRIPEGGYLNLLGCYEREESAMSSRYGSQIINRDPDGTVNGANFFFAAPVQTIGRLRYNSATWRYVGSGGGLFRKAGDAQGAYSLVFDGLSGSPFGTAVTNCLASSQAYLFLADKNVMLKDSGAGGPVTWGLDAPVQPAVTTPFAPNILPIDDFTSDASAYALQNISDWAPGQIGTVAATTGSPVNNFLQYGGNVTGLTTAFNGALATADQGGQTVQLWNIYSTPNPPQFSAAGVDGIPAAGANSFTLPYLSGSVAANATGTIGVTVPIDLSQNYQVTDDDLVCLCMQLSDPSGISEIKLMFDINNSGYTSSYYYKSISPAYYQSGISGNTDAYDTASQEILALSIGLLGGGSSSSSDATTNSIVSQLQSSTANTGAQAWSTILNRRGDFVAVGNAGNPGFDWSTVTGWQLQITTNTNSTVTVALNGIYLQWGAGPSSFGGVGYDYRYVYWDNTTQTPGNPSGEQYFSQQYGFVPSYRPLIVLRQAINVAGLYDTNPRTTHVRIYRRGGYVNQNWFYLDQIPNVPAGGSFTYKDVISDASLAQSDILELDNDPPVTSSLQQPVATTLTSATAGPGGSPYSPFVPQQISVAAAGAVFVRGQIVVIGTPQNLEQVTVVQGGTGSFTGVVQLQHQQGEQVEVFSKPRQTCDIVALGYNQLFLSGDPNNPHFIYYSKKSRPENFGPQNYIPAGSPDAAVLAIVNFRGTMLAGTTETWFQIVPGNPPYAQATGSRHGLVSKTGWVLAEGSIWYRSVDGIREFRGADGPFRSLMIDWVFQDNPATPLPLADNSPAGLASTVMGYHLNTVYCAYRNLQGGISRVIYDTNYGRWRNDDVPATAMFLEEDTNTLLTAKQIAGQYAIVQERVGDADDAGWANGAVARQPINFALQPPFHDLGMPHFEKNWNTVEIDANTNGQPMTVWLTFDEFMSLNIGVVNTTSRAKTQLRVNDGLGQSGYRLSPTIVGAVTAAPVIYQMNVYAAELAAERTSFDTYRLKFGTDSSKIVKQLYLDYTSTGPVTVSVYADEQTGAYYTVVLPQQRVRGVVRVRLPAMKMRLFRLVILCDTAMQIWVSPRVEWKGTAEGQSYAFFEVNS